MVEWVALLPIFGVCVRGAGYEGGGKLRVPWWRHSVAEKQLKVTVQEILEAERERWRPESGRRGESEGGAEGGVLTETGEEYTQEYCYAGMDTGDARVGG